MTNAIARAHSGAAVAEAAAETAGAPGGIGVPGGGFSAQGGGVVVRVLAAISFCHLLNDLVQSLLPAIYPMLKTAYGLSFAQVGFITLAFQSAASMFQPFIGSYTDRHSMPYSLPAGMALTLCGLVMLSRAPSYGVVLCAAAMVGLGSAVFHPESSRVARLASGGRHGLAQSVFQVGGNSGSALGPLLAAAVVLRNGQHSLAWFSLVVLLAMVILVRVSRWYKAQRANPGLAAQVLHGEDPGLPRGRVAAAVAVLLALIFSKYFYLASLTSYYTFYLIHKFGVSVASAQIHLFIFLGAVAAGTFVGGPLGDRYGRKMVIWGSILGVLPFTLLLPFVSLLWTGVLSVIIGLVLASAFSAILVYATELMPGKVGTVAGLFYGFAFGMAGIGAAVLGELADHTSILFVYKVCSFLPLIGLLTVFLPNIESPAQRQRAALVEAEIADHSG